MSSEITTSHNETIGVMLMAFGGPDSLDAVEPFMDRLMKGRKPTPEIIERAKNKYRLIGGKSPLPAITQRQADALEAVLNETCAGARRFKTYVGMRYWRPFIEETIEKMADAGIKRAFAISMSPHHSRVSTGAYAEEIERVVGERGLDITIEMLEGIYKHPAFIDAIAEKVTAAIERFPEDRRMGVKIVFSAHALPMSYIEAGDPYVDEIKITIDEVLKKIAPHSWRIAYQSKGNIPGAWLGPTVEEVYEDIVEERCADVLIVPVGFAADHVETLWDLDIHHKRQAEELGLAYERAEALNDSPRFMEALADMVCAALNREETGPAH
ncbi:MAG: ferrochelatase [Actinobacteria bacterium]|nr:ferrochelatase [Actinomycetota bacterium]